MASDKPPSSQPAPASATTTPSVHLQRPVHIPSYYSSQTAANPVAGPSTLPSQYVPNPSWKNGWTMAAYPYTSSQNITPYPQQQYLYAHAKPSTVVPAAPISSTPALNSTQTIETQSTVAEPCKNWDHALKKFLQAVGLTRALRGLELDMLVMNSDWEKQKIPGALQELANNIQKIQQGQFEDDPLEERKLEHVKFSSGSKAKTPTTLTKSISTFLAEKRASNEASNRAEFLRSLADQRAQADTQDTDMEETPSSSSCARTDAKLVDRQSQIKYDIAKNEDGPLRRTIRNRLSSTAPSTNKGKGKADVKDDQPEKLSIVDLSSERHPGLDERLSNIESHFSVRYVPHPPQSLLDRLRFLEEHIIRIEKDYPPWAAINFNQPSRNWPPPPKQTPIIVPPSLTRQQPDTQSSSASTSLTTKGRNSSLQRAVMERLEIHNAKLDLSAER